MPQREKLKFDLLKGKWSGGVGSLLLMRGTKVPRTKPEQNLGRTEEELMISSETKALTVWGENEF